MFVEGCKIALTVQSNPTGGFSTDSGHWSEIADRGKQLVDYCVLPGHKRPWVSTSGGGAGYAGKNGRLNLVVFARGSAFDDAMITGIGHGPLVGVDGNGTVVSLGTGGRIGNVSDI